MLLIQEEQTINSKLPHLLLNTCDLLRGFIRPEDYKSYFFALFFFKSISDTNVDDYEALKGKSEIIGDSPAQSIVIPEGASFYNVLETSCKSNNRSSTNTSNSIGEHIDSALQRIEQANLSKFEGIFQRTSFSTDKLGPIRQRDELLYRLMNMFNSLNLSVANTTYENPVGDAFKYALNYFAENGGKSSAEHHTPPKVSSLLASLLEPKEDDDICDPSCGSGSLLIECGSLVRQESSSSHYRLYGQEINSSAIALAKMNMFLHGEQNYIIKWGDTLLNPKLVDNDNTLLRFDVIASNPPFSTKITGYDELLYDSYNRFHRGMPPSSKGDFAFISHMVETLKPKTGRMAIVMPHGVLFRGAKEKVIRQSLIEENLLDAIIGLPANLLNSTGIHTAILVFKKNKTNNDILFIDASIEYENESRQNTLSADNISRIISTYKERQSVDRYAYLASFDKVKDNSFNLNIPRYVDTSSPEAIIDINAVSNEHTELMNELNALSTEINSHIKNLGFDV